MDGINEKPLTKRSYQANVTESCRQDRLRRQHTTNRLNNMKVVQKQEMSSFIYGRYFNCISVNATNLIDIIFERGKILDIA